VRLAGEHAGMGLEFSPEPATQARLAKLVSSLAT
jgi:hypothetical protein